MLSGIKKKFSTLPNNDPLQLQLLTLAPRSWSIRKIASEFQTTYYLARQSVLLKLKGGVFAETIVGSSSRLLDTTKIAVKNFYESDENSRMMSGKKDVISVKIDGKRTSLQKRLLLYDLKSLHILFQKDFPKIEIGFSTFAKLRPKNCIIAGASGTHNVCVCTIHENCKLMLDAINIEDKTASNDIKIRDYNDCISQMVCKIPKNKCFLNECKKCNDSQNFQKELLELVEKNFVDGVEYSFWTGTDRCTLLTNKMQVDDFVQKLCQKLTVLKSHSFITKEQHKFSKNLLEELEENEVVVK